MAQGMREASRFEGTHWMRLPGRSLNSGSGGTEAHAGGVALAEVIIVIVLIGLLAGLVWTAVWTARGAAKRAICANQMRQVVSALTMYRDRHGTYPPAGYVVASEGREHMVTWAEAVRDAVGDDRLFRCPCAAETSGRASGAEQEAGFIRTTYEYLRGPVVASQSSDGQADPHWARVLRAAEEAGAVLVCRLHTSEESTGRPMVLVAYEDSSVRWQPLPEYLVTVPASEPGPTRRQLPRSWIPERTPSVSPE